MYVCVCVLYVSIIVSGYFDLVGHSCVTCPVLKERKKNSSCFGATCSARVPTNTIHVKVKKTNKPKDKYIPLLIRPKMVAPCPPGRSG